MQPFQNMTNTSFFPQAQKKQASLGFDLRAVVQEAFALIVNGINSPFFFPATIPAGRLVSQCHPSRCIRQPIGIGIPVISNLLSLPGPGATIPEFLSY